MFSTLRKAVSNPEPTSGASRGLPRVAWLLVPLLGVFFIVYPISIVLTSDPTPWQTSFALGGAALFVGVFLWLMWLHEPLQLVPAASSEIIKYRVTIAFLTVLAGVLSYFLGVEWRMLFFYHINVAAGIMLPKRDAYAVIAGIVLLTLVAGVSTGFAWLAFPALTIGLWATSFVSQVATVAELRAAREELARLAVSEERLRFARDLHDLLGHSLSLITLKSELAERLLPDIPENEKAGKEMRDLQGVARGALREVREAVSGYRSRPSLEEELAGACEMLEAAGIACRVQNGAGFLPSDTQGILTWVMREGVTNVVRHSRATNCEIQLYQDESYIHAEVRDDGRGPNLKRGGDGTGGSGLSGLAERVEASGGHFEAGALPKGGFGLRVSLPIGEDTFQEVDRWTPSANETRLAGQDGRS